MPLLRSLIWCGNLDWISICPTFNPVASTLSFLMDGKRGLCACPTCNRDQSLLGERQRLFWIKESVWTWLECGSEIPGVVDIFGQLGRLDYALHYWGNGANFLRCSDGVGLIKRISLLLGNANQSMQGPGFTVAAPCFQTGWVDRKNKRM